VDMPYSAAILELVWFSKIDQRVFDSFSKNRVVDDKSILPKQEMSPPPPLASLH
jgi:hypothetical protein